MRLDAGIRMAPRFYPGGGRTTDSAAPSSVCARIHPLNGATRDHLIRNEPMPQLHLYVPREIAREVKRRAEAKDTTVSAYLAELVKREVADAWPEDFFDEIVGGWKGTPLERPPQPGLESRDPLRDAPGTDDAGSPGREEPAG